MNVLFFLVFCAVSAYSACGDGSEGFSHQFLHDQRWCEFSEVYKRQVGGATHTVSIDSELRFSDMGALTIKHHERGERLFVKMGFVKRLDCLLFTSLRYNDNAIDDVLVTAYPSCSAEKICLDIFTPDVFECVNFPRPESLCMPIFGGIIGGDANGIDITRYLLGGARFVRMSVPYRNFREVKLVCGQERYGSYHMHGADAETKVLYTHTFTLEDLSPDELPDYLFAEGRGICRSRWFEV